MREIKVLTDLRVYAVLLVLFFAAYLGYDARAANATTTCAQHIDIYESGVCIVGGLSDQFLAQSFYDGGFLYAGTTTSRCSTFSYEQAYAFDEVTRVLLDGNSDYYVKNSCSSAAFSTGNWDFSRFWAAGVPGPSARGWVLASS